MIPPVDPVLQTLYQIFSILQPFLPEEEKAKKLLEAAQKQLSIPLPQEHPFYHEVTLLSTIIQTNLEHPSSDPGLALGETKKGEERGSPQIHCSLSKEEAVLNTFSSNTSKNPIIKLVEQVKKLLQILPTVATVPSDLIKKIQRTVRNSELRMQQTEVKAKMTANPEVKLELEVKLAVKVENEGLRTGKFESKPIFHSHATDLSVRKTDFRPLLHPLLPSSLRAEQQQQPPSAPIAPFSLPFAISSLSSRSLKRKKERKEEEKEEDALFPHDQDSSLED